MSEVASNPSIENQEAEIVDLQVEALAENLNVSKLSDNDSASNDSIPGMLIDNNTHVCMYVQCVSGVENSTPKWVASHVGWLSIRKH